MDIERLHPWPEEAPPAADMTGEDVRAKILGEYGLDSLEDDPELASIAEFAAELCEAPTAMVSLVEAERQRFLSRIGSEDRETNRGTSFCAHAMLQHEILEVPDATQDPRFADFALVTGKQHVRFYAGQPLISHEGAPLGALCVVDREPRPHGLTALQRKGLSTLAQAVMRRLRHRREILAAQAEFELGAQRLRTVFDSLPDIAYSIRSDGTFEYINAKFSEATGEPAPVNAESWRSLVHPDDHEPLFTDWFDTFEKAEPFEAQFRLKMHDGTYRWHLTRVLPVDTHDERERTWFGTLTDIEDTHRQAEARGLLAKELSHRIKNIFAVIGGLVALKSREYPGAEDFTADVSDTLQALNRAHSYVTQEQTDRRDTLHGLLEKLMQPYGDRSGTRFSLEGADVAVNAKSATPLALVFHELATNSAKYGSFSVPNGSVAIEISLRDDSVVMRWRESGGPPPKEDRGDGFGSRLVERSVGSQLGGTLTREFETQGLSAILTVPVDKL